MYLLMACLFQGVAGFLEAYKVLGIPDLLDLAGCLLIASWGRKSGYLVWEGWATDSENLRKAFKKEIK